MAYCMAYMWFAPGRVPGGFGYEFGFLRVAGPMMILRRAMRDTQKLEMNSDEVVYRQAQPRSVDTAPLMAASKAARSCCALART